MVETLYKTNQIAPATIDINEETNSAFNKNTINSHTIQMHEGGRRKAWMSIDGRWIIAGLSSRTTVTFYNVSKVISVPAKMIDPASKERFIERTLLDKVSGQIHPGQIVALMGPSGNYIVLSYLFSLHVHLNRLWKNDITQHTMWPGIKWCHWRYLVQQTTICQRHEAKTSLRSPARSVFRKSHC